MNKNDNENFAVNLTDSCDTHTKWLAVVRFGLGTLLDNMPLLFEIICREAERQLIRKDLQSRVIADEARFIFQELGLRICMAEPPQEDL